MNRETYQKAFDEIPFSPDFQERTEALLRERVPATNKEDTNMKFGQKKKMALLIAAAVSLLVVSVSAANVDAIQDIVWQLRTTFFVSGTTEDGSFAAIRVPDVTLDDRDDRVVLVIEGVETDITDALEAEQVYTVVREEEDGWMSIEVAGTPEDCICTITGYQQDKETPLFTVTREKNQQLGDTDVEYTVPEEVIEVDGSTVMNTTTVTITEDDEFVVGHYSEDWGDIYGLVTDDAEQIEHLDQ